MITASDFQHLDVPSDLMGRFGEPKERAPRKKLRAGQYWVVPTVREDVIKTMRKTYNHIDYIAAPANDNLNVGEILQQHSF